MKKLHRGLDWRRRIIGDHRHLAKKLILSELRTRNKITYLLTNKDPIPLKLIDRNFEMILRGRDHPVIPALKREIFNYMTSAGYSDHEEKITAKGIDFAQEKLWDRHEFWFGLLFGAILSFFSGIAQSWFTYIMGWKK